MHCAAYCVLLLVVRCALIVLCWSSSVVCSCNCVMSVVSCCVLFVVDVAGCCFLFDIAVCCCL